jgi:signal recognition particle GTPase
LSNILKNTLNKVNLTVQDLKRQALQKEEHGIHSNIVHSIEMEVDQDAMEQSLHAALRDQKEVFRFLFEHLVEALTSAQSDSPQWKWIASMFTEIGRHVSYGGFIYRSSI